MHNAEDPPQIKQDKNLERRRTDAGEYQF